MPPIVDPCTPSAPRGSCELHVASDSADVKDLVVFAGAFRVEADWTQRGHGSRALVLIETGPFALAIDDENGHSEFHPIGARDWFRQRVNRASTDRMPR